MSEPDGRDGEDVSEELIALERAGWEALSSTPDEAVAFYERVLDEAPLMLFPGGLILADRSEIVRSMSGPPWASFELWDVRVLRLGADTAAVTYAATAQRAAGEPYSALMSSVYVRRGTSWRLALHQQTPW